MKIEIRFCRTPTMDRDDYRHNFTATMVTVTLATNSKSTMEKDVHCLYFISTWVTFDLEINSKSNMDKDVPCPNFTSARVTLVRQPIPSPHGKDKYDQCQNFTCTRVTVVLANNSTVSRTRTGMTIVPISPIQLSQLIWKPIRSRTMDKDDHSANLFWVSPGQGSVSAICCFCFLISRLTTEFANWFSRLWLKVWIATIWLIIIINTIIRQNWSQWSMEIGNH